MSNKIWTKKEIKGLLATNKMFVVRSCVKLYERQLADEQASKDTIER